MEATPEEKYESYLYDFTTVINTRLGPQSLLSSLGRARVSVKEQLVALKKTAGIQLNVEYQIKLFQSIGKAFVKVGESELAVESFSHVMDNLSSGVEDVVTRTIMHTEALYAKAQVEFGALTKAGGSRTAPVVVSKVVGILRDVHKALIDIFELSVSQQEELSWLILNGCKIILKLSQPFVWLSCGKYVADVLLFSAMCMESVINLCTTRHLKFRMKVYTSAFYNTVIYGSEEDSQRYLAHVAAQVTNLREQEELDLPVPERAQQALLEAEVDLATMRAIMALWVSPEQFANGDMDDETALMTKYAHPSVGAEEGSLKAETGKFFRERVLSEYCRVQQLTSGNRNEVWRRRCDGVMKGFKSYFETVKPEQEQEQEQETTPAEGEEAPKDAHGGNTEPNDPEADIKGTTEGFGLDADEEPEQPKSPESSVRLVRSCVLEMLCMNLFCPKKKEEDDEEMKLDSKTQKLVLKHAMSLINSSIAISEVTMGKGMVAIVQCLYDLTLVENRESDTFMEGTLKFTTAIDACLAKDGMRLRRSALLQVALVLWNNSVYPSVQKVLSRQDQPDPEQLRYTAPSLLSMFKIFNSARMDDAVMLSSMSLLVGNVYMHLKDYRTAISVLSRSLDNIDRQRSIRVDLGLHCPVDSTDLNAIQHASFTSQSDAQDWFNSIRRLGAHAFAGFGIFGSASVAERSDYALAELHTDLMTVYMRAEIQYALYRKRHKKAVKFYKQDKKFFEKQTHDRIKFSTKQAAARAQLDPPLPAASSFYPKEESSNPGDLDVEYKTNTDNLRIKGVLSRWCVENTQAHALLQCELAQVDSRHAAQIKMIEAAKNFVVESEKSEVALKESQHNLTVMTSKDFKAPIVMGRSHAFIYAVPAGSKKYEGRAKYYRLFAKEDNHGTLVTLGNDELAGTENAVPVEKYEGTDAVEQCSSKIVHLKWGKKYVFASVAFDEMDKTVGKISPTSLAIEAKNPLANILMWAHVHRVAMSVVTPDDSITAIAEYSAVQICNFYFFPTRQAAQPRPFTLGKGKNMFVGKDIIISMLKVQLSSSLQLQAFVEAFLYLVEREDKYIPSRMRRNVQTQLVTHLRTVSKMALIARYSGAVDLVSRCVAKGHDLLSALTFSDDANLANELQNPTSQLVVALQSTPKKNWTRLEHHLYTRLLSSLVRIAVTNRNVAPVVPIFNAMFTDEVDTQLLKHLKNASDRTEVEHNYMALQASLWQSQAYLKAAGENQDVDVLKPFENVFPAPMVAEGEEERQASDVFHESSPSRRLFVLMNEGEEALSSASSSVLPYLASETQPASKILFAALQMMKLVAASESGTKRELLATILEAVKIQKKKVAPGVMQLLGEWSLTPFEIIPDPEPEPAAEGEDAGPDESGGEGTKKVIIAEAGESVGQEEERRQLFCLAEILYIKAQFALHPNATSARNLKPTRAKGPDADTDIAGGSPYVDTMLPAAEEKGEEAEGASESVEEQANPHLSYFAHLGCAVIVYSQAGFPSSGVYVVVTLWNHLTEYWVSPEAFGRQFVSLKAVMPHLSTSVVDILNSYIVGGIAEENPVASDAGEADDEASGGAKQRGSSGAQHAMHRENSREYLYCCQDFLLFIVQVHWLYEQYADLVSVGSRALSVFLHTDNPDLTKVIGENCSPIVMEAQSRIIQGVENQLAEVNNKMTTAEDTFAASMKLKRRKKKRLTNNEKDDDELAHEANVEAISSEIASVKAVLDNEMDRMGGLRALQKSYEGTLSTGLQLMYKVRANMKAFVAKFRDDKDRKIEALEMAASNAPTHDMSPEVKGFFDDLMDEYAQLSDFLREKQDRITLVETLNEQGDIILLAGFMETAKKILHDSLDGYFNVMDAFANWPPIVDKQLKLVATDNDGAALKGLLFSTITLGKLSKFCAVNEWDTKINYCRFAAELCRIPFLESYGHPFTLTGFAAYVCKDFGGIASFLVENDRGVVANLSSALEEVIDTLMLCDLKLECLPAVVLLEHLHMVFTRRSDLWLKARIMRLKLLLSSHLFAEAASMMAAIKPSLSGIMQLGLDATQDEGVDAHRVDTKKNHLDFFGMDPFFNHLLPSSDENQKALAWVEALPADLRAVIAEEEEKIAAKSSQPPAPEGGDAAIPEKIVLVPAHLLDEITALSATFFVELSLLESNMQTPAAQVLGGLGTRGVALGDSIFSSEGAAAPGHAAMQDGSWITLRTAVVLMKVDCMIQQRNYMPARHLLLNLVELLKHDFASGGHDQEKKTLAWFKVRDRLSEIAERQARWTDVVTVVTQGLGETAITQCSTWSRRLTFRRAYAYYQMGDFENCMTDCESVCQSFEEQSYADGLYVRCLCLRASIIMDFASSEINGISGPLRDVKRAIAELQKAQALAEKICAAAGFIGADSNLTFTHIDTNVSKHSYFSPILHHFTTAQQNAQNMFVKRTASLNGYSDAEGDVSVQGDDPITRGKEPFRRGPVDEAEEDMLTRSEYANLYLTETRSLAACYAALVTAYENFNAYADHKAWGEEELPHVDESGLKVLRFTPYVQPQIRATLLQGVGNSRPVRYKGQQVDSKDVLSPLVASLNTAVLNMHDWATMRNTCAKVADLLTARHDETVAMKFVLCAIKLSAKFRTVANSPIGVLNSEDAFGGSAVDDQLSKLIKTSAQTAPQHKARSLPGPNDSAYKVCGADAIFLLSSMIREFESLWIDAPVRSAYLDVHSILGKSSALFKEKCLLAAIPTLDDDTPAEATPGTVSTLWLRDEDPKGSVGENSKYSQAYDRATAYFVRGAAEDGSGSAHLSKMSFNLAAVQDVKKTLLNLRRSLSLARGDESKRIVQQTQEAMDKLSRCVIPVEGEPSHKSNIIVSKSEDSADIVIELKGPKVMGTVTLSDKLLLDLSDIFSVDKDADAIESGEAHLIVSNIV